MKSKPPNKKARVDTSNSSAESSPAKKEVNPTTTTGASTSNSKASIATTASEILAAAKLAAAATAAEKAAEKAKTAGANSLKASASRCLPTYPTVYMPDLLNSKDYSRMGQLIHNANANNSTGAAGNVTTGRPPESLTMEDIDMLQSELESLWSNISVRIRNLRREQTALQNSPNVVTNVAAVLGEHFDPHHQEKINAVATLMDAGHGTRTSVSAAAKLVMGSQIPISISSSTVTALLPIAAATPGPGSSRKSTSSTASSTPGAGASGSSKEKQKQPKKKLKGEIESKSKKSNDKPARAGQNRSHSMSSDDSTLFHQKAPNQFWDFADSYVREITPENLDALDKSIEEHSKALPDNVFNIPPVGKHYLRGVEESSIGATPDRGAFPSGPRRFTDPKNKAGDICGPLTQRLVSALVEDRISGYNYSTQNNNNNNNPNNNNNNNTNASNNNNSLTGIPNRDRSDDATQGFFINRPGLVRALGLDGGLSGGPPLESRLRQVLLEQGLLLADDAEDASLMHPNDEILADIKNTQATLKKLHMQNAEKYREMRELAKREIERVALKKDLEKADKDVLEAYRLISSCRVKKKSLTKKERDIAAKALESRTSALLKLQDQPQFEAPITTTQSFTLSQPSVPM